MGEIRPANFRSLSSKFSRFTVLLFLWMVGLIVLCDVRSHAFNLPKAVLMCAIVVLLGSILIVNFLAIILRNRYERKW